MKKILYSQCWEDPLVLEKALNVGKKDVVLSISSAGDNTLYLLSKSPKKVISIDINEEQNFLLELKTKAIEKLSYNACLIFLGYIDGKERKKIYLKIRSFLTLPCRSYWDKNIKYISKGVIHLGKFERYLSLFRKFILPFSHLKREVKNLLLKKSLPNQKRFYDSIWNNFMWRMTFHIFFSSFVMKLLGRDRSFFNYSKKNNISSHYLNKARRGLTEIDVSSNYFLHYIARGKYAPDCLPEYMKKKNFYNIKKNIKNLKIITKDLIEYLNNEKDLAFTKYNFSDVFEVYSQEEYESVFDSLIKISKRNALACYWNNLVIRKNKSNKNWKIIEKDSKKLLKKDRAFFYDNFILEKLTY